MSVLLECGWGWKSKRGPSTVVIISRSTHPAISGHQLLHACQKASLVEEGARFCLVGLLMVSAMMLLLLLLLDHI